MQQQIQIRTAAPLPTTELRVNGLSLLFFDYYRLDARFQPDTQLAIPIETPDDYLAIIDLDSGELQQHRMFQCREPLVIASVPLEQATSVGGTASLLFRLVADSFLVTVTVINLDETPAGGIIEVPRQRIKAKRSLVTSDILTLIRELNELGRDGFNSLRTQRMRILRGVFGPGGVVPFGDSRSRKNVGIQIWSIANPLTKPIDGIMLSRTFAWELAALLECTSDLILHDTQSWRARRHDQVESLVEKGTDILADHRVLTHRSVCLEISQVAEPKLKPRSAHRLGAYGFDSTSLYLWCVTATLESVLIAFNEELAESLVRVRKLAENNDIDMKAVRDELKILSATRVRLLGSVNDVFWLTSKLREQRHVAFFHDAETAWSLDTLRVYIEDKFHELSQITAHLLQSAAEGVVSRPGGSVASQSE